MEWIYSLNVLIFLWNVLLSVSASCPQCSPGFGQESCKCVPCKQGYYSRKKIGGEYTCDTCTDRCSARRHLVQIKGCGISTNRVCHCAKGFYCPDPLSYTCLVQCKPCDKGTFSDEASLAESCKPHTDCDSLGLVRVLEGKADRDHVCAAASTASLKPPSKTTRHSSSASDDPFGTPPASPTTHLGLPDSSGASATSAANRLFTRTSIHDLSTSHSAIVGIDSQSSQWLVVLLLLLAVSVLVGCFLWLKSKALKKQLKWTRGLPFGKYQAAKKTLGGYNICVAQHQQEADMGGNACLEQSIPLTRDSEGPLRETGASAQPHPGQGSMQRITVDNSGKGESISNTVGSIFIYSPGMVVLGTNASERKAEVRQEDEEQHLALVPQQESPSGFSSSSSSSCQDSVGLSTQEDNDDDKELSYPIPASSK